MIGDYEDDTHFCLKCHSTILGLDNYVAHRKAGCTKNVDEQPKSPLPSQLLPPDESFSLKADDFFSSLELQSSNKKSVPSSSSGGKSFSGILTRSKTTAVIQATNSHKDNYSHDLPPSKSGKNAWIGGHQLKELGSGDNQTKLIKAVDNLSRHSIKKDEPQQLHVYEESDEDSVDYDYDDESDEDENNEAPPRSYTGGKWKPSSPIQWARNDRDWNIPSPQYTGGKWKPHSTTKISASPPPSHTKGKWKPQSPVFINRDGFDNPPPNFTGSKWSQSKAMRLECSEVPLPTHTKGKWKPSNDLPSPDSIKNKWKINKEDEFPPPEHTKGKWKPVNIPDSSEFIKDDDHFSPPTNYTKGKWKPGTSSQTDTVPCSSYTKGKWKPSPAGRSNVSSKVKWSDLEQRNSFDGDNQRYGILDADEPPFRKSSGTVQYWCRPCNRRLASKIVYERHLKSELHFKRTLHDREFDDTMHLNTNLSKESKRTTRKPVEYWSHTEDNKDTMKNINQTKRRFRRKIFIKCEVCRSRVNSQLMGKHLISHYHCRKGDITLPEAKSMVLEYIYGIVLQAPYQCGACKFYCNTQKYFLRHWESMEHKVQDQQTNGYYFCSFCKFETPSTQIMLDHLVSEEHNDVIAVINRSVPIVIKKIKPIECQTCQKRFLLNIQLRKHCERRQHAFDLNNQLQNNNVCSTCDNAFSSKISLQRHKQNIHREEFYICTACNLNFNNKMEAKIHRRTSEHRYAILEKRNKERKSAKELNKKCDYCCEVFENFPLFKQHLKEKHPEHCSSCPHCGKTFTVSQEVTVHIRTKSCTITKPILNSSCDICNFATNSPSELLFHKVLHTEPLLVYGNEKNNRQSSKRPEQQYKCPVCEKFFSKASLRCHLRLHTKERPYVCSICNAGFVRKSNWLLHVKRHKKKTKQNVDKKKYGGDCPFLCSTCGASFKKKSILQLHMTRHSGKLFKCPEAGCVRTARTMAELNSHLGTHSDVKPYSCDICDYKGKTKQQLRRHKSVHDEKKKYQCPKCPFMGRLSSHLKRHMRLHTGAKPFACPHCDYRCNNLENLRKHVLSTNKHPGKCIYECKFCGNDGSSGGRGGSHFQTNFAREFKVHLVMEHSETFESGTEAVTYIAGIYEAQDDATKDDDVNIDDEEKIFNSGTKELLDEMKISTHILQLDPIVTSSTNSNNQIPSTILFTSTSKQEILIENKNPEELFPTFVISKDVVCVENPNDAWNMVGSYDVEESGELVPFQSDGETLFQEHFN